MLAAGLGTRFRPATDRLPKALLPFLNVPLLSRRLTALGRQGIRETAVNLHHEGRQIVEYLAERPGEDVAVRFFWEREILGTAGALKNAEPFLEDEDFLVWNVDAEISFDLATLARAHRTSGALLTLLVAPNPDPARFTPLAVEGGRLVSVGSPARESFLFTGVSIVAPRALRRIGEGPRSLVADLWGPVLGEGREEIRVVVHGGDFFDLGTPGDFLAGSLRALETRADFDPAEGVFDPERRALCPEPLPPDADLRDAVAGRVRVGGGVRIRESILWNGADVSAAAELRRCLVGPLVLPAGGRYSNCLLWPDAEGRPGRFSFHGRHLESPAV